MAAAAAALVVALVVVLVVGVGMSRVAATASVCHPAGWLTPSSTLVYVHPLAAAVVDVHRPVGVGGERSSTVRPSSGLAVV